MIISVYQWLCIGFILCILTKMYKLSYVFLLVLTFSFIVDQLYKRHHDLKEIIKVSEETKTCRKSTISNPMSNLLPHDRNPTFKACKESENVKIDNLLSGFLREQNDDINKEKLNPFITMPDQSILGEKDAFSKFISNGYDEETKTCKYDGVACQKYRDLRFDF